MTSTEVFPPAEAVEAAIRGFLGDMGEDTEEAVAGWLADEEMMAAMVRTLTNANPLLNAAKDAEIVRLTALHEKACQVGMRAVDQRDEMVRLDTAQRYLDRAIAAEDALTATNPLGIPDRSTEGTAAAQASPNKCTLCGREIVWLKVDYKGVEYQWRHTSANPTGDKHQAVVQDGTDTRPDTAWIDLPPTQVARISQGLDQAAEAFNATYYESTTMADLATNTTNTITGLQQVLQAIHDQKVTEAAGS